MLLQEPEILLEDAAILVVNKPAGLLTIRDGYDPTLPFLAGWLLEQFGRVWTVHRLDKDTSGVIIFARNAEAHRALNLQFDQRGVAKTYHALVRGIPSWKEHLAAHPLRVNGDRRHRTVIDPSHGKPAETQFRVLETFPAASLIESQPHTGYTHQIRAHLAFIGFPLLGDILYGGSNASTPVINRAALHARRISFTHPVTAERLTVAAPYAPDFQDALVSLRKSIG